MSDRYLPVSRLANSPLRRDDFIKLFRRFAKGRQGLSRGSLWGL